MLKPYLRRILGIFIINIFVIGGFVLSKQIDLDENQAREFFLTGQYDQYISYVSPKVPDQSLKYWRILAQINVGNIQQARKELIQLDFSYQSPIALVLLQVLSDIEKGSYDTVWGKIQKLPKQMNIRERSALNQLYLFSLLKLPKKQVKNMNATLSDLQRTSASAPFVRLLSAAVAYENKNFKAAHNQFERHLSGSNYGSPFFDFYAAKAVSRIDPLLGVIAFSQIKDLGSGIFKIDQKDLDYWLARSYSGANMYDELLEILSDVQFAGGSARDIELLTLQGRANIQLGNIDEAWNIYTDLVAKRKNNFGLIVEILDFMNDLDDQKVLEVKQYISQRKPEFNQNQLMTLYQKFLEVGEETSAADIFDYLTTTYPEYAPALFVVKKEFVDSYVLVLLDDSKDLEDILARESALYEKFGYDPEINLIVAIQRYIDGNISESYRYAQLFNPLISDKQLQLYAFFFYGTFDFDLAKQYFDDKIFFSSEFSELEILMLERWIAEKDGDIQSYTELSYELENMRTELRAADRKGSLHALFNTKFKAFTNFWIKYKTEDEQ